MRLEKKTPCSNLFNTNNSGRCSQMYPWWPFWLSHYPHIKEDGPERLTPCLLNVSDRDALSPFLLPQQRVFPQSHVFLHVGTCLFSICARDVVWDAEWVLVLGVCAGRLPGGSSAGDKDVLHLLPRLHLIIFLMEGKYWTTQGAIRIGNKH